MRILRVFHIFAKKETVVYDDLMKNYAIVTGASTGIGFASVKMLAEKGYFVLAGVRSLDDQVRLEDLSPHIQAFILDVAKSDSIAKAFAEIEPLIKEAKTVSLVNNAGIAVPGPIEGIKIQDFKYQFDVNVFGLVEWTQLLIPIIRKTKGKIINISSISGLITSPFFGAYAASKHALESLSDALRRELLRFGVEVILIEPGPIRTPIWTKGLEKQAQMTQILRPGVAELYQKEIQSLVHGVEHSTAEALPVECVAVEIVKCIERKTNPTRILIYTLTGRLRIKLIRFLPTKWVDKLLSKFFYR